VYLSPTDPGSSHGFTFRQVDDFLYFTGLELPGSILAIDSNSGEATIFAPRRDPRYESMARPNDFPGRPLADDPAVAEAAGIAIHPFDELRWAIRDLVDEGHLLRINSGRDSPVRRFDTELIYEWTAAERLIHHLQKEYPEANIENAFRDVAELRMVKSAEEIEAMRRVIDLTTAAIRHAASFVRPGVSERALEAELEAEYKRGGGQRLGFSSIIKSGPNSLWPWRILAANYDRRNRTMSPGDLVIFDVGTELDYYVSDVGRTFPVSGSFTPLQREKLLLSTAVSDAIIAAIRPGVTFADLMVVALAHIPEHERKYMQTGTFFGHHIGLNAGDPALPDAILQPGMVFTVEPWYYNHDIDISVFVEDVVLVTNAGAEVLTRALPRLPEELESMVGRQNMAE
jgi:Xaa-Pro aminopeptidase